jgi:cytoskeletal protein RodZ
MTTCGVGLTERRPCLCPSPASVRQRKGMALEEIAESTRIATHFLQAIEAEEFTKLPGGVYSTSYIRQYARAIGYSETALLDQYYAQRAAETEPIIEAQPGGHATTRLGEAVESFLQHVRAKHRAQHSA